jgi:argininosuccinate lyase
LWGGRFSKGLDERALRYTTSLPVDRRLFEWDVLGSIAHARMLGRVGIIPAPDAAALTEGLSALLVAPPPLEGSFEDIHSLVEAELRQRVGEPAGRLHTARSRNDQVATDTRLFARSALIEGVAGTAELQSTLVLWSTAEFGFVSLDESFTTGSSLMPQKRNPDVAELVRGKAGRVYGALVGLLVTLKGLPMSYNRDLQEDKAPYFEAVDVVHDGLALTSAMLSGASWRTERMASAASDPLIAATDLADHLAQRGVPFRQAHEIVGRIVRSAESSGRGLSDYSLEELREFSPAFEASAVGLKAADMVAARRVVGGPAPDQVRVQLKSAAERTDAHRAWVEEYAARLPTLGSVSPQAR